MSFAKKIIFLVITKTTTNILTIDQQLKWLLTTINKDAPKCRVTVICKNSYKLVRV